MRTQKKRKNTSFRLQGGLCCSALFPQLLFRFLSLSLTLSLSVSPVSLHLSTLPLLINEESAGSPQMKRFPKCFPVIAFFSFVESIPFIRSFISFSLCSQCSQAAWTFFSYIFFFHLRHECLKVCIAAMSASYMSPCFPLIRHILDPFLFTQTHIITHINTVPKKHRRHWTPVNAFMYRLSVAMYMLLHLRRFTRPSSHRWAHCSWLCIMSFLFE